MLLSAFAWALLAACSAAAALWAVVLFRVVRMAPRLPHVRAGLDVPAPEGGWPRVSVVIPAHNEERVLDECATALRAQDYPDLELVFVLDRCTDRSGAILDRHAAEDDRIVVVRNEECPPEWAGKCNAARRGADVAGGAWLLFTDADTSFDPRLVRASMGAATRRGLGLLSLLGRLTCHHWFERVAQPVAAMNLIRMYPIERANRTGEDGRRVRPFANGQFLLFDRAAYDAVGGHAAVRDDLLEDIAFARLVHERGHRAGIEIGADLLTVAMYDRFDAFRTGWRRIFIEACRRKPVRLVRNAAGVLAGGVAAPVAQLGGVLLSILLLGGPHTALAGWILGVVGVGVMLQGAVLAWIYRQQYVPWPSIVAFPVGSWIVAGIMLRGASDLRRRRPVRWGGREYVLEPR